MMKTFGSLALPVALCAFCVGAAPSGALQCVAAAVIPSVKTATVEARTGKFYVPSATLLSPEPGAKRGSPRPGSFKILVISPVSTR